jgi:hypothetical protein
VDIVRNSVLEMQDVHLSRFEFQIINHPDESIRSNFQEYLRLNKLSSHVRVVARRPVEK